MADPLASSPKYKVLRRIAVGGMGEVLLADFAGDADLKIAPGRLVLKRTLPRHPNREHQNEMLLEEGRIGIRLLHENLVETFAVDESGEDPLLIMEFLGGRSMAQVLGAAKRSKRPLPVEHALRIARDSACGLHFAHTLADAGKGLGLVHRDVSPANIFVTFDGRVKVIDFGVAKASDSEIRTSTGILKGKIGYMSPEHAAGETLTPATDLWSIGVVLWEMLVANRLFAGATPALTLYQITHGLIERPEVHRPDLPPAVSALVMRLLERNRADRVSTGAELVAEIDAIGFDLDSADIGSYLREEFPAEAERAKDDSDHAAIRDGPRAPSGLIDGSGDVNATLVHDADEIDRIVASLSSTEGTAKQYENPDVLNSDAPTLAIEVPDFGTPELLSDEDEIRTVVDDGRIRALMDAAIPSESGERATRDTDDNLPNVAGGESQPTLPSLPSRSSSAISVPPGEAAPIAAKPAAAKPAAAKPNVELQPTPVVGTEPAAASAPAPEPAAPAVAPSHASTPETGAQRRAVSVSVAAPNTSARTASRTGLPVPRRRPASTAAVAMASFGAIALVLGVVFSFVAHRRAENRIPQVFIYPDDDGIDVVVARTEDAQANKQGLLRAIDLAHPIARVAAGGPRAARDPIAFSAALEESKVFPRARLPMGGRKTAAGLPPAIVLLSLVALALSLPGFLGLPGVVAWVLRLLLVGACVAAGFFGVTRGILSWPGTDAYSTTGSPPRFKASGLATTLKTPPTPLVEKEAAVAKSKGAKSKGTKSKGTKGGKSKGSTSKGPR